MRLQRSVVGVSPAGSCRARRHRTWRSTPGDPSTARDSRSDASALRLPVVPLTRRSSVRLASVVRSPLASDGEPHRTSARPATVALGRGLADLSRRGRRTRPRSGRSTWRASTPAPVASLPVRMDITSTYPAGPDGLPTAAPAGRDRGRRPDCGRGRWAGRTSAGWRAAAAAASPPTCPPQPAAAVDLAGLRRGAAMHDRVRPALGVRPRRARPGRAPAPPARRPRRWWTRSPGRATRSRCRASRGARRVLPEPGGRRGGRRRSARGRLRGRGRAATTRASSRSPRCATTRSRRRVVHDLTWARAGDRRAPRRHLRRLELRRRRLSRRAAAPSWSAARRQGRTAGPAAGTPLAPGYAEPREVATMPNQPRQAATSPRLRPRRVGADRHAAPPGPAGRRRRRAGRRSAAPPRGSPASRRSPPDWPRPARWCGRWWARSTPSRTRSRRTLPRRRAT